MKNLNTLIITIVLFSLPLIKAHASAYSITDLGNFYPTAINSRGQILGNILADSKFNAAIYDNGQISQLGSFFGSAFNDSGQILGDGGHTVYNNGQPSGIGGSGQAINSKGQITGQMDVSFDVDRRAFLYNNGQLTDIGTLGGLHAGGIDINEKGQITGWAMTADFIEHAFFYSDGQMTDLDPGNNNGLSFGAAINDKGQIVGGAGGSAFLYSNGQMINIGPLGFLSKAIDINNSGQVIGEYITSPEDFLNTTPFLYSNGEAVDFNSLILDRTTWRILGVKAIGDNGQIIADGYNFLDQAHHGLLLTPAKLPVPGAAWFFGSALIGGFRISVKRRKHIDFD